MVEGGEGACLWKFVAVDRGEVQGAGSFDELETVEAAGEWGFVRGTYRMTLNPVNGDHATRDHGQFIDLVQKDAAGRWKIARAIWNSTGA